MGSNENKKKNLNNHDTKHDTNAVNQSLFEKKKQNLCEMTSMCTTATITTK